MRAILAMTLALALSACTIGPGEPDGRLGQPEAAQSVQTLAGAWRVAGIDGNSLDEPYGIALEADDTMIWWAPRCARQERLYQITGSKVRFTVNPELQPGPGKPGVAVCMIGLPPRLADITRALDAAERIERTEANGILISGGGHSLTLFSQ
jgi:hypothetical protein